MSDGLHLLIGVQQRVTSAYHPQSNGLVERQKKTIKNSLVKVLEENPLKWPSINGGVLFTNRVSKHSSTKYSPFKLLYKREEVKYKLSSTENPDPDDPFDKDIIDAVLASSNVIREEVHRQADENIKMTLKKQQRDYEGRVKSSASNDICIEVLLRNNKCKDRKDGKFTLKYVVSDINKKVLVILKKKNDKELKKI